MEEPLVKPAETTRQYALDLLRLFALFAVVMIHVAAPQWALLPPGTDAFIAHSFYDGLARFSVPVFFMVSGALFLNPARAFSFSRLLKKNLLRLVTAYLFWSAVYVFFSDFFKRPRGLVQTLIGFVLQTVGGAYHLWFIVALIGLYLIVPFLRRIAADRKLTIWFLLLWLIFGVGLQSCQSLGLLGDTFGGLLEDAGLFFVLGYSGYFLLGRLLFSEELGTRVCVLIYCGALIGLAVTVMMTLTRSRAAGVPDAFWFDYLRPNVVFMAAGVCVLFKRLFGNLPFAGRRGQRLAALSQYSFGAYLCHVLFIYVYENWLHLTTLSINPWLSIPLYTLFVGAAALLMSCLLNKIPFVNRWFV